MKTSKILHTTGFNGQHLDIGPRIGRSSCVRPGEGAVNVAQGLDSRWFLRARCNETQSDDLFIPGAVQNQTKVICRSCPVWRECLSEALDNNIEFGVWGGATERQRRYLKRKYPNVRNWGAVLLELYPGTP